MLKIDDNRLLRAIAFATILFSSIGIFWYSLSNPIDHWDMLGYAGSLLSTGQLDPISLHTAVYSEMQNFTTAAQFESLISLTTYRETMYQDSAAFYQQIPFFKIRVIFLWILGAMTSVGFGIYEAMHLLSAGFGSASLFVIYLGFRRHVHSLFWIVSPYLYYEFTQSLYVTRSGGVDSFSVFWVALICIAFFRFRGVLMPLLAFSVLVRTDLIVFVAMVFLLLFLEDRATWRKLLFWVLVTLVCYVGVNQWAGNYGWHTVIHYVFATDMLATHPETYSSVRITLVEYLGFLINPRYWINNWFWVGIGSAIAALVINHLNAGWTSLKGNTTMHQKQRLVLIGAVCLLYSIAHYLLFPAIFMRFFFGHCFLMSVACMSVLSTCLFEQYSLKPQPQQ